MQAEGIGSLRDKSEEAEVPDVDPNDKAYALGDFTTNTPQGNVCFVSNLTPTQQKIDAIRGRRRGHQPPSPATTLGYVWGNVRFLVTAQYYGSQFSADLTINRDGDECRLLGAGPLSVRGLLRGRSRHRRAGRRCGRNMQPDEPAPRGEPPAHPTGSGINPTSRCTATPSCSHASLTPRPFRRSSDVCTHRFGIPSVPTASQKASSGCWCFSPRHLWVMDVRRLRRFPHHV